MTTNKLLILKSMKNSKSNSSYYMPKCSTWYTIISCAISLDLKIFNLSRRNNKTYLHVSDLAGATAPEFTHAMALQSRTVPIVHSSTLRDVTPPPLVRSRWVNDPRSKLRQKNKFNPRCLLVQEHIFEI